MRIAIKLNSTLISLFTCLAVLLGAQSATAQKKPWRAAYDSGNYNKAIKRINKELKTSPDRADLWNGLGLSYSAKEKRPKAETAFKKAVELEPGNLSYRINLGVQYMRSRKYEKAKIHIDHALRISPEDILAVSYSGILFYIQNQPQRAFSTLTKAISLKSTIPNVYDFAATIYTQRFRTKRADGDNEFAVNQLKEARRILELCSLICSNRRSEMTARAQNFYAFQTYYSDKKFTESLDAASGSNCTPLKITEKPRSGYTAAARKMHATGSVRILVIFNIDGTIGPMMVVKGLPYGLNSVVIEAAKKIKFEPPVCNGTKTYTVKTLVYNFSIGRRA